MSTQKPSIIFMGTPEFAEEVLSSLIKEKYSILSIFTQPDKKVGRRQEIQKSPVKVLAEKNNLRIFQPVKLDAEITENIKKQNPDLIIISAYGKIIPAEILAIPALGCLNTHPSMLPKFRGASPIQNALLSGETSTGTTIMLMDAGVDTGPILNQESVPIEPDETYPELSQKLAKISAKLLLETIPLWIDKKITPQQQDDSLATHCQMFKKEDGQIGWDDTAKNIFNKFRAFYSWPGIFTFWQGKRIKLISVAFSENNPDLKNGTVFSENNRFFIKAEAGSIEINEVQLEGKPVMDIKDFLNGYKNFVGSVLE